MLHTVKSSLAQTADFFDLGSLEEPALFEIICEISLSRLILLTSTLLRTTSTTTLPIQNGQEWEGRCFCGNDAAPRSLQPKESSEGQAV